MKPLKPLSHDKSSEELQREIHELIVRFQEIGEQLLVSQHRLRELTEELSKRGVSADELQAQLRQRIRQQLLGKSEPPHTDTMA